MSKTTTLATDTATLTFTTDDGDCERCGEVSGDDDLCASCRMFERVYAYVPDVGDQSTCGAVPHWTLPHPCPVCENPVRKPLVNYLFTVCTLLCGNCDHWEQVSIV